MLKKKFAALLLSAFMLLHSTVLAQPAPVVEEELAGEVQTQQEDEVQENEVETAVPEETPVPEPEAAEETDGEEPAELPDPDAEDALLLIEPTGADLLDNLPGDDLVLHIDFEEENLQGGMLKDLSTYGHNGTVIGAPQLVDGVSGKAMYFVNPNRRSATQYVTFGRPDTLLEYVEDFSFSFWVKTTPGTTQADSIVLGNKDYNKGQNIGFMASHFGNGLYVNMSANASDSSYKRERQNIPANDGEWHHVAATYQRDSVLQVYLDGTAYGDAIDISMDAGKSLDSGLDFTFGADGNADYAITHTALDEVRMYHRALTAGDVAALYEEFAPEPAYKDEVLYVSFDPEDVTGTTMLDKSGRGNNGTVVGSPEYIDGIRGKAMVFDNTNGGASAANQYVDFGVAGDLQFGTGDFAYSFWVKSLGGHRSDAALLGNKDYGSGSNLGYIAGMFTSDMRINISAPGGSRVEVTGIRSVDGEWHHVAASYNRAGNLTVYMDGTRLDAKSITGHNSSVDTGLPFVVGADGRLRYGVKNIAVDELHVYNRQITKAEVDELYLVGGAGVRLDSLLDKIEELMELYPEYCDAGSAAALVQEIEEAKARVSTMETAAILALLADLEGRYDSGLFKGDSNLRFFLTSDPHVTSSATAQRNLDYITGLQDMQALDPDASAFVTAGDNTQDSREAEYQRFYSMLDEYNPVADDRTLVAIGNHDVRGPSGWGTNGWYDPEDSNNRNYEIEYWSVAKELYFTHNARYMPAENVEKELPYYDRWIDGYHFIVVNPEAALKDRIKITQTQLDWLDAKLAEDADPAKPKFVIIHQSLNDTHWRSNILGGFGDESDAVKATLGKYPGAIALTGHIHNGLGVIEGMYGEWGATVEVPAYTSSENGLTNPGHGFYVRVYDDMVVFRARNFLNSAWLPEHDIYLPAHNVAAVHAEAAGLERHRYTDGSLEKLDAAVQSARDVFSIVYDQSGLGSSSVAAPPVKLWGMDAHAKAESAKQQLLAALEGLEEKQKAETKSLDHLLDLAGGLNAADYSNYSETEIDALIAKARQLPEYATPQEVEALAMELAEEIHKLRTIPRKHVF